jgi:hypothetical protein
MVRFVLLLLDEVDQAGTSAPDSLVKLAEPDEPDWPVVIVA